MLDANRFKATHRSTVVAILGAEAPPVTSKGDRFFNIDRWTARAVVAAMCAWAGNNPGVKPSRRDVEGWVAEGNADPAVAREIVIAETPVGDALTHRVAMALVGGGYHEAFHTKYSCRRGLSVDEVSAIVLPRWNRANWLWCVERKSSRTSHSFPFRNGPAFLSMSISHDPTQSLKA